MSTSVVCSATLRAVPSDDVTVIVVDPASTMPRNVSFCMAYDTSVATSRALECKFSSPNASKSRPWGFVYTEWDMPRSAAFAFIAAMNVS